MDHKFFFLNRAYNLGRYIQASQDGSIDSEFEDALLQFNLNGKAYTVDSCAGGHTATRYTPDGPIRFENDQPYVAIRLHPDQGENVLKAFQSNSLFDVTRIEEQKHVYDQHPMGEVQIVTTYVIRWPMERQQEGIEAIRSIGGKERALV